MRKQKAQPQAQCLHATIIKSISHPTNFQYIISDKSITLCFILHASPLISGIDNPVCFISVMSYLSKAIPSVHIY